MSEYGRKVAGKVKAMKSEIKRNVQGTNSEGKETRPQIKDLEQKEKLTLNRNGMKKQEFRKNEKGLRNLQNDFIHSNI